MDISYEAWMARPPTPEDIAFVEIQMAMINAEAAGDAFGLGVARYEMECLGRRVYESEMRRGRSRAAV